ncbi:MAG: tyrosine-type recombinase/integrase [Eubacteriales bacterium]
MNDFGFIGPFADELAEYITLKRSVGYRYLTDEGRLRAFDYFTSSKYPYTTALTKEIVLAWCAKTAWETDANRSTRASVLRQFALYLYRNGKEAFVLPKGFYPTGAQYSPYIYTDDELRRFFEQTDRCHAVSECPYRHLVMPVFFRMIYSCGLRCSEARLLKCGNVDLENGVLQILNSKNDRNRVVPMPPAIIERCRIYSEQVHSRMDENAWFFPGVYGREITSSNAYHNFRRFLYQAGISHGGRGKGPRIHDFRHTFACRCLKKWSVEGRDLNVWLPVLKAYMGHESFSDTAYYLRLTADVYPEIHSKLNSVFPAVIPEPEVYDEETD